MADPLDGFMRFCIKFQRVYKDLTLLQANTALISTSGSHTCDTRRNTKKNALAFCRVFPRYMLPATSFLAGAQSRILAHLSPAAFPICQDAHSNSRPAREASLQRSTPTLHCPDYSIPPYHPSPSVANPEILITRRIESPAPSSP